MKEILTQYKTVVQPSIVIHWNTVSIAKPMWSKLMMPNFGPSQKFSLHSANSVGHLYPLSEKKVAEGTQGVGSSSSSAMKISSVDKIKQQIRLPNCQLPSLLSSVKNNSDSAALFSQHNSTRKKRISFLTHLLSLKL